MTNEYTQELDSMGTRSGLTLLTEAIKSAYIALLESEQAPGEPASPDSTPPLPDGGVYVSPGGSEVLGLIWSDNSDNIDDEDWDRGYNCYTIADRYRVKEGFDPSQLPCDPAALDGAHELELTENMTQFLYKRNSLPSEEDALDAYYAAGWKKLPCGQ